MTLILNLRTETRPYSGYEDPSLPVGAWIGAGSLVGDASAGFLVMNFLFQFGQQPLNSQMYNVERVAAEVSVGTTQQGHIETRNMDELAPNRPVGVQRWSFALVDDGADNAIIDLASQAGLPMWLGRATAPLLECGVRVQFTNTNLLTYTVALQGYFWGPRSILAPGGPQRPPNGFLGN